jgi:hypothetical protein
MKGRHERLAREVFTAHGEFSRTSAVVNSSTKAAPLERIAKVRIALAVAIGGVAEPPAHLDDEVLLRVVEVHADDAPPPLSRREPSEGDVPSEDERVV